MKNISRITRVNIKGIDGRLGAIFEGNRSYNFCIIISELNSISLIFLKDSLIKFFLNTFE